LFDISHLFSTSKSISLGDGRSLGIFRLTEIDNRDFWDFQIFLVLIAKNDCFGGAGLEFWRKSIHKNFRAIQRFAWKRAREKEKLMDC